ncbi:hypothetical protein GGI18_000235 [Coemansia linderi]|uniref:Uncharacterized protein n=1 Tax=Coemansia linderi TaxID=2663919 RepID=A0ACC1KQ18_9FUNG|nr:hypothetical protein GGI18_000235 [Coemansia linderi]
MDASPLLGKREYEDDTALRPAAAEQEDIALLIRVVALVDNNNNNNHSGVGLANHSLHNQITASQSRPDGHQWSSQLNLFSPLVLAPTAANTPSPAAATIIAGDMQPQPAHSFVMRVGLRKTTVEDLARAIEATYSSQPLAPGILHCAALFRGDQPLLFGSRVRDVLRENDFVIVYGSIGESSGNSTSRLPRRRSDIGSDVPCSGNMRVPPTLGADSINMSYVSLVAPVSSLLSIAIPSSPSAVAAHQTLAAADMARVGELVAQAPLKARFINVLIHPVLLRGFLEFCALPSELALESLLFVLDVERFRHVQPSMARLLANYIYLSYVAPSAPLRINVSGQMRDRIPWPFLPGWEYNPWVFDEILASVGFTLKKHTLLRFERSPVGLAALMDSEGFSAAEYTKALRFDLEFDPMVAIADMFEPDIDVVIWVNDLDFDSSGTRLVTSLTQLAPGFRQQLLERVCAQFVDQHRASALCDGYFHLVTHIKPLQKQRRIKKTRKIRNFFGDNPHEALLRQQLMAVVPPSSQMSAARAAAELMARKKSTEVRRRAGAGRHCRHDSATSSVLAEQQLLAIDSDSDLGEEHAHGWATKAMMVVGPDTQRVRSWSDSDDSDDSNANGGQWTPDEYAAKDEGKCQFTPLVEAATADTVTASTTTSRRGLGVYGNDQVLCRALSMIGVSQLDSQESSSSAQSSPCDSPAQRAPLIASDSPGNAHLDTPPLQPLMAPQAPFSYSVYSAHAHSLPSSIGRADGRGFERKKRVNRLREFFGRSDAAPSNPSPQPASALLMAGVNSRHSHGNGQSDAWNDTTRSTISTSTSEDHTCDKSAGLSAEQRNLLVRRRRKLNALLGEQVEETIVGHGSNNSMEHVMSTPEPSSTAPSTLSSINSARAGRPQSQLLESSSLMGDISEEQRTRARWRRNKLVAMLGDVPTGVTTVYRTDFAAQNKSDSEEVDDDDDDAISDGRRQPRCSLPQQQQHRQRARKLRHFFGQSLEPDSIARQTNSPRHSGKNRTQLTPVSETPEPLVHAAATPISDVVSDVVSDGTEETSSYEFIPLKSGPPPCDSATWEHIDSLAAALPDLQPPNRAQFWVTTSSASSPESQASVLTSEKTNRRASLIASLRARKASIIGSIKRATPSTASLVGVGHNSPQTLPLPRSLLASKNAEPLHGLANIGKSQGVGPLQSVKPLSPLPPISPNNFQASFDRGMALREVVAVAEYISSTSSPHSAPQPQPPPPPPPRVSSAAACTDRSAHDHRRVIASALLASNRLDSRSRPALDEARVPRPIQPKTVHWFDSPQVSTRRQNPSKIYPGRHPQPPPQPVAFVPFPPCPPPPPNSAKTSLDLSMSIVLRSPSSTKPSIKSPIASPRPAPATAQPPPPPPRMALTHKASITAVGGHAHSSNKPAKPIAASAVTVLPLAQSAVPCYNNIVTIRPRRSHSFAIHRKLDNASVGRKRSHTIGSGRQAASRLEVQAKDGDTDAMPLADKPSRRVQSMIVATQVTSDGKQMRSRCVTVIPLRLELQRLLAAKLASMGKPHSVTPFRISATTGLNTIRELDEFMGSVPEQTPAASAPGMSRMQSIQLTTDALCAASNAHSRPSSSLPDVPVKQPRAVARGRSKSWQLPNAAVVKHGHRRRPRSQSCPAKIAVTRFKRAVPPIQPAVARYLSSANASRSPNTSPTRRGLVHMSAPYHRISLALLSRPATTVSSNRLDGRLSLGNQTTRLNSSLPPPSSLRRFASVDTKLATKK